MLKKIDKWLLLNRPLLWNMRIHYVLPVLLLLHVLLYIFGFFSVEAMTYSNYYSRFDSPGVVTFSIFAGVVVVLLWLSRYLRNNAFASGYPMKKSSLFLEFCLQFVIIVLAGTMSLSHSRGRYDHMKLMTSGYDGKAISNTIYTAYHLIPFSLDEFRESRDCDNLNKDGYIDEAVEYDTLGNLITTSEELSYLHYCSEGTMTYDNQTDKIAVDKKVKTWLKNGDKEQVKKALTDYVALLDKFKVRYKFDVDAQVATIFATPRFLVQRTIDEYDEQGNGYFIDRNSLENVSSTINRLQPGDEGFFLENAEWIVWLYVMLGFTIALFSFRITRLRQWFMAIIGAIVWGIILMLIGVAGISGSSGGGFFLGYVCMAIWVGWVIFSLANLNANNAKGYTGIAFNWWFWTLPYIGPTFLMLIAESTKNYNHEYSSNDSSFYSLIMDNVGALWSINLIVVIAAIYFLVIPFARKWQAMPEE